MFWGCVLTVCTCLSPDLFRRKCSHFGSFQERAAASFMKGQAKVLRRVSLCTCRIRETSISSKAASCSGACVCPSSLPRPERMRFQFIPKISKVSCILHRNMFSQPWHQISLRCQRVRETAGIPTLSHSWQMRIQSGICGHFYSFGTKNHWVPGSSWAPAFTPFRSLKLLGS